MIKALIFDLDDTLYAYEAVNTLSIKALADYTCDRLGICQEEFERGYLWARNETKKNLKDVGSGHNRMIYCQKTLEFLHENPLSIALEMYEAYWSCFLEHMKLNSGVLEVLKTCKENQIKIGICTDLTTQIQHRKLRNLQIDSYIDAIVTSEEAGKDKPDEHIFNLILDKLSVLPEEACYIGDSLKKDIIGAARMGIKTCWYTQRISNQYKTFNDFHKLMEIVYESK